MEFHPSYEFTNNEWNRLTELERLKITEERERYKISHTDRYGGDTRSVAIV